MPQASLSSLAARSAEAITGTSNRLYRVFLAVITERLAQAPDVHVHGSLLDEYILPPDRIEQLPDDEEQVGSVSSAGLRKSVGE